MRPEQIQELFQWLLGGGGLGGVVLAGRSLVRGRKEDEDLDADIQVKLLGMADDWLTRADARLQFAEERATRAEQRLLLLEQHNDEIRRELDAHKRMSEERQRKLVEELDRVYAWIDNGYPPPPPQRKYYLPEERQ